MMWTVPAACDGRLVMLSWVALVTVKQGAPGDPGHCCEMVVVSTATAVALKLAPEPLVDLKPVPVIPTELPPAAGPAAGASLVTEGIGAYT